MIRVPAPPSVHGRQLADQITAAGFTDVQVAAADGDLIEVTAAELARPDYDEDEVGRRVALLVVAAQEDGQAPEVVDLLRIQATRDVRAELFAAAQSAADAANTDAFDTIAPVVAAHVPVPAATDTNRKTLEEQAVDALAANATYLALATPTNAQVAAQVRALTRQSTGLIRLVLNRLDSLNGA